MNENIWVVLNKLWERWEITPRKPRTVENEIYSTRYEPLVAHIQHITWINDLPLDYTEFESILGVLVEQGFITRYKFYDDLLEVKFAEDFEEKYSRQIGESRSVNQQELADRSPYDDYLERTKKIQKEHEESFEKRAKENRDKIEQRERIRIERVKAGGGNQLAHAIQEIVNLAILNNGTFDTSIYDLGFEETQTGISKAGALLSHLTDEGCISAFSRLRNDHFKIEGAQIKKLRKKLDETKNPLVKRTKVARTTSDNLTASNITTPLELNLDFDDRTRKISVNGIFISKPNFDSTNDSVMQFIFNNPDKTHSKEDVEKGSGVKLKKTFHVFLNDIRIKGKLREYLFQVTGEKIVLRRSVMVNNEQDIIEITKQLKELKK